MPARENQLPDTDLLSHPHLASEAVETPLLPLLCVLGWGAFFWLPKTEAAPAPWAGTGGIWCVAGTEQADGDQKKEEKPSAKLLDPYRELFSSIPISPAKPKGVEHLLARDLGLTVSPEFCKPSPLL